MLELIERHRVTRAMSIGPIAPQIMAFADLANYDLSSLRLFITMSAADRLEAHLNVPCSNLFGITEGLLLGSPADASEYERHHTQGRSGCPEDDIRLLAPGTEEPVAEGQMGELCFRGPATLSKAACATTSTAAARRSAARKSRRWWARIPPFPKRAWWPCPTPSMAKKAASSSSSGPATRRPA
jgi:non-ribosomal peptide synthetase component E (peptide arylation enzyme)